MSNSTVSRSVLALVLMLLMSTVSAQERSHPSVGYLSSVLSDYFNPTDEWPWSDPNSFGQAVAIRNETAAVGMPTINEGRGRVAIFQRSPSGWQRTGTLVASDAAPGQQLGSLLSFRDDTIIVGASSAAYVFKLINGAWQQTQKLTIPSTHVGINFPASLVYQDGLVVAGATSADGTTSAVYFFQLTQAGKLVQRTRLLSPAGPSSDQYSNDLFGASVALTNTQVLIGAPGGSGAAYLYAGTNSGWRLQQKLTASDAQPSFGSAVAINNGVIAVGAPSADQQEGPWYPAPGAVYLFASASGVFTQTQKITPPIGQPYDDGSDQDRSMSFGFQIAMSRDRLVVAADEASYGSFYPRGSVLTYRLTGGQAQLTGAAEDFISTTSISLANDWLLVGVPREFENLGWETFGNAVIFDIDRLQCAGPISDAHEWRFDSIADGWTPVTGTWSVTNGAYANAASGASILSMANQAVTNCYNVSAAMYLSWTSGVANSGGFVYDYQDQNNYRELTLSRSASNRQLLTVSEVRQGARRVVSSKEGNAWRPGEWVQLGLERNQDVTTVHVDGMQQLQVTQTPSTAPNRIGLLARWNLIHFDSVWITVRE